MKKNRVVKFSSAAALLATVLMASSGAHAGTGSRLCGWVAYMPNGQSTGILYEARMQDTSYTKQCDAAISDIDSIIKKDPALKAMPWTKINKYTCEAVGVNFTSTRFTDRDMCNYMTQKQAYKVVRQNAESTTYTKM